MLEWLPAVSWAWLECSSRNKHSAQHLSPCRRSNSEQSHIWALGLSPTWQTRKGETCLWVWVLVTTCYHLNEPPNSRAFMEEHLDSDSCLSLTAATSNESVLQFSSKSLQIELFVHETLCWNNLLISKDSFKSWETSLTSQFPRSEPSPSQLTASICLIHPHWPIPLIWGDKQFSFLDGFFFNLNINMSTGHGQTSPVSPPSPALTPTPLLTLELYNCSAEETPASIWSSLDQRVSSLLV